MEKCLVTKLKGVVDNDNLDYLGYIKVKVLKEGGLYAGAGIKALQGTFDIQDGATNQTELTESKSIIVKPGTVLLVPKYSLSGFQGRMQDSEPYGYSLLDVDVTELSFKTQIIAYVKDAVGLTADTFKNVTGIIDVFIKEKASVILEGHTNATRFMFRTVTEDDLSTTYVANSITGNIENFIAPNITYINLVNDVKGDLKVWAEKLVSAGHEDGTIYISNATASYVNKNLIWDGKPISDVLSRGYNFYLHIDEGVPSISLDK